MIQDIRFRKDGVGSTAIQTLCARAERRPELHFGAISAMGAAARSCCNFTSMRETPKGQNCG